MTLEDDIREIKYNVQNIKTSSGPGCMFYLTSFFTATMATCGTYNSCNSPKSKDIQEIKATLQTLTPQLHTENLFGTESPEKFYLINGQRVYLEIDGKAIEEFAKSNL